MTASLPDSGDGRPPPRPDALPRPGLWSEPPPGHAARAFDGLAADDRKTPRRRPERVRASWLAVAVMVLGAVLVGVAFVLTSVALGVAGVLVGLLGIAGAVRSRILAVATVGQSPEGSDA